MDQGRQARQQIFRLILTFPQWSNNCRSVTVKMLADKVPVLLVT
jgi:hypothetical protein